VIRGSCLCGVVEFEIEGETSPIQHCHAERCRKASGSATSPELIAPASGFRWTRGEERLSHYEAPILHEPPAYRRSFCGTCGSPMPVALEGTPFVLLQAGVLDDDPGKRPFRHAFVDQKAIWHDVTDGLPEFEGVPPPPDSDDLARIAGSTDGKPVGR
jgi:hypothetical protein